MSGGSYDYAWLRLEDFAADIRRNARGRNLPESTVTLRLAFADLMAQAAVAARELELVDSGDSATGAEIGPLQAVLSPLSAGDSHA